MSNIKWTKEQEQAIYENGSNILVAAAAGSGKTAVLVERIINKILNENIDIDKLLVVTFTNAAASEMRERVLDAIYSKLEENPGDERLQRQITLLNKASICTIDSFCLDVIKNNFYEIDISPNFRIADTTEINLLKQDVLEELFENKYEAQDENFKKLVTTYTSYRDDSPLKDLVLKIYTYIQSNPFPNKWLEEKVEMFNLKGKLNIDFAKTIWGEKLLEELEEELIDDIVIAQKIKMNLAKEPELDKFEKVIDDDIDKLQTLKLNLNSWDKAYEIANNLTFSKWPVDKKIIYEEKEIAKQARDNIKKKLKKKIDKILAFNSEEANKDIYDMYEILNLLKNLILEFDEEFIKAKKEKNILDFNDIEHFALQILLKEDEDGNYIQSEAAKIYQERFNEIAIDEYQDSNLVQEYILNAIQKNNNIFMVGDVKQSIYRFRQARPELFLEKYAKYKQKENKKEDDNLKIKLFKNFRSRKNILDFTNLVFEKIMSNVIGDIDYNEDEYLNLGANYKELPEEELKTEIDIINLKDDDLGDGLKNHLDKEEKEDTSQKFTINHEELENLEGTTQIIESTEVEAKFVANKIQEIIDTPKKVFDTKTQKFRNATYKDVVILLRSTKDIAPVYEKELINHNIPVFCDTSSEYLDSIEIQTIMSVLKVIDNPLNDIPLVTCLRSNIGGFTDNDLVEIRLSDKYDNFYSTMEKAKINVNKILRQKIEKFLNNIDTWRKEQEYLSLDELIWKIYTDTGYYNYVGLMPNGDLRQANLKKLFERAKQFETASFKGLYNFIRFIEKLELSSGDLGSAKLIGENENVIRIMSIHKSKGLEFPIVILAGTGKQFNLMDLNDSVLLHHDMGFGVKYINYDRQIEYDTLSKAAMRNQIMQDTLSEEMRILYVALTRAKEKLIITASLKDMEKEIKKIEEEANMYCIVDKKTNPVLVKKYKRFIDWILLTSMYENSKFQNLAIINKINKKDILEEVAIEEDDTNVIELFEDAEKDEKELKRIANLLEFEYAYKLSKTIPTKTSVTRIKQMRQEEIEDQNMQVYLEDIINNNEGTKQNITFKKPQFLREDKQENITSSQKGTLIHMCMQRLDYRKDYKLKDVQELIQELQAKKIITEKEANVINIDAVYKFTKSTIWQNIKEAKEVYQEKPFYINIPAKEIYKQDVDETILVQGIIDLYYIDKDDNLILVDYKTDYVEYGKEAELVEKYKEQLKLYSRALEQALSQKTYKTYIYSTCLNKAIELKS